MTEKEWLECTDPTPMLEYLQGKASDRKLRLFAVACCRRAWHLLTDERSRNAVEIGEQYADGQATDDELRMASEDALLAAQVNLTGPNWQTDDWRTKWNELSAPWAAVQTTMRNGPDGIGHGASVIQIARDAAKSIGLDEINIQTGLVREIFGNPFRPITLTPSWLTPTAKALAEFIYDDRGFDRLPFLADTIEEAGCTNADILAHCRSAAPHVRGCWAIDLILGKQ